MIFEQSSGGIPFNFVSSSRATCLTNLIEFCKKKKRKNKNEWEEEAKKAQSLDILGRFLYPLNITLIFLQVISRNSQKTCTGIIEDLYSSLYDKFICNMKVSYS